MKSSGEKERLTASIVIKQKSHYLGSWARAEDAAVAFDLAYLHNKVRSLFKLFCRHLRVSQSYLYRHSILYLFHGALNHNL